MNISQIASSLGEAINNIGMYSAQAAAQANEVSRQAQSAQGAFNQNSADIANDINAATMGSQWAFNSGQATAANLNQMNMWQTAANWNSDMWEKQAAFNREEAERNRKWQEHMASTQYQRAVADMSAAGLNPILAVNGGGVGTSVPGGSTASVGGAQMSSANAQMASGSILGAHSASESNYMGTMEYMSTTLALLGTLFNNLGSAEKVAGQMGKIGKAVMDGVLDYTGTKDEAEDYNKRHDKATKDINEGNWWDVAGDFLESMWKDRPGGWVIDSAAKKK